MGLNHVEERELILVDHRPLLPRYLTTIAVAGLIVGQVLPACRAVRLLHLHRERPHASLPDQLLLQHAKHNQPEHLGQG